MNRLNSPAPNTMIAIDTRKVAELKRRPAEALYVFMGWLTRREESATFSNKRGAPEAANLVAEFCKSNKLPDPDMAGTPYRHPE